MHINSELNAKVVVYQSHVYDYFYYKDIESKGWADKRSGDSYSKVIDRCVAEMIDKNLISSEATFMWFRATLNVDEYDYEIEEVFEISDEHSFENRPKFDTTVENNYPYLTIEEINSITK